MCARRLAAEVEGWACADEPVNRTRLREAFLNAAQTAHTTLGVPDPDAFTAPPRLEAEEREVFDQAARWYLELYGDRSVQTHLHDCDRPTDSPRRGVRIGGWVDLTLVGADGHKELRQVELWGGRAPQEDPLELERVLLAVLRLARWCEEEPLLVSWADLVRGLRYERLVDMRSELAALTERFELMLCRVRERTADPQPVMGMDCGECKHVWRCSVHPQGINVTSRRNDLRPGVVKLSPTSFDAALRCKRAWRDQYLLSLPASDEVGHSDHGLQLHSLLRFVHEHGSCRDPAHVDDVMRAHGAGARLRDEVRRHADRCPISAESVGHELEVARFHRHPWPPFMVTARLDAAWVHDGALDVRDYKSGRSWYEHIAEDPRAKVQAWAAARLAAERGLSLRVRYEYLAVEVDEDPEPWDLEPDDLAAIEDELRQTVEAIHAESDWQGVNDESICGHCRYRSICPDSAVASEPLWPLVEDQANSLSAGDR
jgi:PD-(D/E)XK nuclease superfamily